MNRLCPICNSKDKTFIYQQKFNNKEIALMKDYGVVTCKNCGFCFSDHIPSQAEFDNYYKKMSKYEFQDKEGMVAPDYIKHFTNIVNFLIPYLHDKKTYILDIGCATGSLLSVFKLKGYKNLLGIDPSPYAIKTTNKLYGIEADINTIANFKTNKKFDLIILSAVLEHLVDLNKALKTIWSLLKENGLLFIEVPDVERFTMYISAPYQQFSIEHINYFSQYSLKNLLSSFSFEAVKVKKNVSKLNQTFDPDIFVISKKIHKKRFKIIKDNISELKIRDYIAECSKIDLKVKQIIQSQLSNKKKIIVWGAGTHTQRLIGYGLLKLSKILYFVDSNERYIGKKLNCIKIKSPDEIKEENPILISTYSYQEEISRQIREVLKLNNKIITIYES